VDEDRLEIEPSAAENIGNEARRFRGGGVGSGAMREGGNETDGETKDWVRPAEEVGTESRRSLVGGVGGMETQVGRTGLKRKQEGLLGGVDKASGMCEASEQVLVVAAMSKKKNKRDTVDHAG
jgi:hypothetical protein